MDPITQQQKRPKRTLPKLFDFDNEAMETLKDIGGTVTSSLKKDLAEEGAKDLWKQILGKYEKTAQKAHKLAGELEQGQEFDLTQAHQQDQAPAPRRHDIAPGLEQYNYHRDIVRSSERAHKQETRGIETQVEQIMVEIKQLVATSQQLEAQFVSVTVQERPAEVGKYHQTFFEWMLITLRNARMKIEDSGSWLGTMANKKGKKNYWSMFKKHGTSFGMSNERSVATQTG